MRRERHGSFRSGCWYTVQTLALVTRFVPERLADASTGSLGLSWLDVKLGFRMIGKHPGLSLAGGSALAVTIAFGAGLYDFFGEFVSIELPFPEGDRIVRVTHWDAERSSGEPRSAADFVRWRQEARSIDPLAALTEFEANVAGPDGVPVPVSGVRTTASLFDALRVPPHLGRPLVSTDEADGAARVVVVSRELWLEQLGGASLDGLTLRIAGVEHEVVGVMPEGFRFPVDHHVWVPLRIAGSELRTREGPLVSVFGRLAPGVSKESAQAEFSLLGRRASDRWPATHAHLEPRVTGFGEPPGRDWQRWVARGLLTGFGFLLALAALNVAILSFSRTASRQGEIAVRSALGAGRRRIVTQLFSEALVLSVVAALVGLAVAWRLVPYASELFWRDQGVEVPYWVDPGLSAETIGYALLLAVLGAAIAGVVPALKVTGKGVAEGLRSVSVGGSPLRFGLLPTVVIVLQVAMAVAFLPFPVSHALARVQYETTTQALAGDRILSARLQPTVDGVAAEAGGAVEDRADRFGDRLEELRTRLAAEPGVAAVTFGDRLPGQSHRPREIHLDGPDADAAAAVEVRTAAVDPGYFEALGARLVAGRTFGSADLRAGPGAGVVVVNEAFARQRARGASVVGRRIRFAERDGAEGSWLRVVGIVVNLDVDPGGPGLEGLPTTGATPAVYRPTAFAGLSQVYVAVRLRGPASAFGPELRRTVASVDPEIRVDDVLTLDGIGAAASASEDMLLALAVLLAVLVAGLAVGGTYTLMSFLVQQRTREIGIRTALGADPAVLLRHVFSRALEQLTVGLVAGLGILFLFMKELDATMAAIASASAALVLLAGVIACVLPARRALRIEPTEALRSE